MATFILLYRWSRARQHAGKKGRIFRAAYRIFSQSKQSNILKMICAIFFAKPKRKFWRKKKPSNVRALKNKKKEKEKINKIKSDVKSKFTSKQPHNALHPLTISLCLWASVHMQGSLKYNKPYSPSESTTSWKGDSWSWGNGKRRQKICKNEANSPFTFSDFFFRWNSSPVRRNVERRSEQVRHREKSWSIQRRVG